MRIGDPAPVKRSDMVRLVARELEKPLESILQGGGHRFEPCFAHHRKAFVDEESRVDRIQVGYRSIRIADRFADQTASDRRVRPNRRLPGCMALRPEIAGPARCDECDGYLILRKRGDRRFRFAGCSEYSDTACRFTASASEYVHRKAAVIWAILAETVEPYGYRLVTLGTRARRNRLQVVESNLFPSQLRTSPMSPIPNQD